MQTVKRKVMLLLLSVMLTASCAGLLSSFRPKEVFAADATFTLNGSSHVINTTDPWEISEGESSWGILKINSFRADAEGYSGGIVYTTKWLYSHTPVRENAYEYAFEYSGNRYVLSEKNRGGNTYIPVNGLVISLTENDAKWESAEIGTALQKNVYFPDYAGAVEIYGTGTSDMVADKTIRIGIDKVNGRRDESEAVYYNSEWGTQTQQNEFGAEILCSLQEDGSFKIMEVRNVRDMNMSEIGSRDFVLSIHGSRRVLLGNDLVSRVGDKVELVGMKFVDLNKSASLKLTAKNPTKPIKDTDLDDLNGNLPFPGYRAENYFMYYDANYDKSGNPASAKFANFTGCNEWGYEILVRKTSSGDAYPIEGVIESHAKQVDNLLSDGESFILSGNGSAETYLTANALNGARVTVAEDGTVTITTTPDSYVTTAVNRYDTVNSKLQSAIDAKYKLNENVEELWAEYTNTADALIGEASDGEAVETLYGYAKKIARQEEEGIIDNVTLADFYGNYLEVLNLCYGIESLSYQAPAVMSIAAWHRPVIGKETSVEGIRETLELFKKVNFNTVYLETFWNGYSMSSDSEYVDYHIEFKDCDYSPYKDYLSAFIGEAHKLGIEVHAWVEDFFVGYEGYAESNILTGKLPNSNELAPDAAERSGWVITDYQGNQYTQFEGGKYKFIDPSNPDVRAFLVGYYKELLTKYDLDGINLDYIRYPVQNGYGYSADNQNVPYDHGYSEFAAKKFLAEQGYAENQQTLAKLKRDLNKGTSFVWEKLYSAWTEFKVRQINEFVKEIYDMVKELETLRGGAAETYSNTDIIISTSVFPDSDVVTKKCQDWEYWFKQGWIEVATPMAYYENANTVTQKIAAMIAKLDNISYNYGGIAPYFMGLNPYEEVVQAVAALSGGSFGTVIFDSKTIMNSPEAVEYLSNGIYGNAAILPHKSIDKLLAAFAEEMKSRKELYSIEGDKATLWDEALDALKAMPFGTAEEIMAIRAEVYRIQTNARDYASGYAITRIAEEMENLNNVLDVKLSRYYIESGEWVPADGLRPDQVAPDTDPSPDPDPGTDTPSTPAPEKGGCKGCNSSAEFASAAMAVILSGIALALLNRRAKRADKANKK